MAADVTIAEGASVKLPADLPQGAIILENHSMTQAGFASFTDMANHNALLTSATAIVV